MPRHKTTQNQNQDRSTSTSGHCRIRKRVSSSSSSSSAVNKLRIRGHFLQLWGRVLDQQRNLLWQKLIMGAPGSPFYRLENDNYNIHIKGKESISMSARKLAASLWEMNGLKQDIFEEKRDRKDSDAIADPPTPVCDQRIDRSKVGGHRRRCSAFSQKLEIAEGTTGLQTIRKLNSIEVASGMPMPGQGESVKSRLKEVSNSIIASKELVKVLFRILSQEEQHSSRMTLVSALRVELERARLQVDRLVRREAQLAEAGEKAGWKSRERERVSSLAREVEIERKLRRRAERLNKKMGMELAGARGHFARAMKEVEGERRAREALEQTCHELAAERVALQELKREAAKAREELENERQMLQLADVLREERVQMKLAEARYEYEEKNAALERLKTDIIASYNKQEEQEEEEEEQEDSGESELHSIELNMDNSNSYRWSIGDCDSRRRTRASTSSMDQAFKGRRSLSDNIQWETICLQRNTSPEVSHSYVNGLLGTSSKHGENYFNEHGDEFKRNNTIRRTSASPANSSPLREACSAILQDLASRRLPAASSFPLPPYHLSS